MSGTLNVEQVSKWWWSDEVQLALWRWDKSYECWHKPGMPEMPSPSSGEWLEFLGIELEGEEDAIYPVNGGPIDECDLGQDFQTWRRDVKPVSDISFREWEAPQLPGYVE